MPSRIIFGSCSSQHYEEQPLWPVILQRNATAFVWGGDAVYADDRISRKGGRRKRRDATPEYLRNKLTEQRNHPGYKALLETNISIFGTVDDHDYGTNNGDRTFEWRLENAVEYVRFLDLSEDSPVFRRAVGGHGVYGVQVYDLERPLGSQLLTDAEAGLDPDVVPDSSFQSSLNQDPDVDSNTNKLVAVFVLDIRSNRSPWSKSFPQRFQLDADGDMLGEQQWHWFETALSRSTAAVNVVVTGLQVHPERFIDSNLVESWGGFPRSQQRLYQALTQPNVQAPILISGDVHHAQLLRKDCRQNLPDRDIVRPLYEITTSGMTHSWGTQYCGRLDGNPFCHYRYYRILLPSIVHLAHWLCPWKELVIDDQSQERQYSLELNVAELEFDWDRRTVVVSVLGVEGRVLLQQEWPMNHLTETKETMVDAQDFETAKYRLAASGLLQADDDSVCVHYRGLPNRFHFAIGVGFHLALLLTLGTLPMWLPMLVCWKAVGLVRKRLVGHRPNIRTDKSKVS